MLQKSKCIYYSVNVKKPRQCQHASKVISPFIAGMFAVFDVSCRRYSVFELDALGLAENKRAVITGCV